MRRRLGLAVLLLALGGAGWLGYLATLGAQAYLYAYPLVLMEANRVYDEATLVPQNALCRIRRFPDAAFRGVVRPNADTLYTVAWLDMDAGPFVFSMAENTQRYAVMSFMDAWSNVFATPGTRASGTGAQAYLLAGPRWQGVVPAGLTLLRAPTRMVRLIGRTQVNGAADLALVHGLQDGLQLQALAGWRAGKSADADACRVRADPARSAPFAEVEALSAHEFFDRFARLWAANPSLPGDAAIVTRLQRLDLVAGHEPPWSGVQPLALGLGRVAARSAVELALWLRSARASGWIDSPRQLGTFGDAYLLRAATAMIGLGANLAADSIYPYTLSDASGARLDGSKAYRLHFEKGNLPPVRAFWSISAYGSDDYFIDHGEARHAIGDRDALHYNADGSLDILVQATAPEGAMRANWLPVKRGAAFLLNARLYWPKEEALDGRWHMPPVLKKD